jgi:hypothetical protein
MPAIMSGITPVTIIIVIGTSRGRRAVIVAWRQCRRAV